MFVLWNEEGEKNNETIKNQSMNIVSILRRIDKLFLHSGEQPHGSSSLQNFDSLDEWFEKSE